MNCSKINLSRRAKIGFVLWQLRCSMMPLSKRAIDVLVSISVLALLSPLMILVAILIRLESQGGALFKQQRVGANGVPFTMWKFRSMCCNAENQRKHLERQNEMAKGVTFKMKRDPRITRIGAVIRKTSIDELPQLVNVLKGDMSLVGPRPPLPNEVSEYSRTDRYRLAVAPGITCLWQISGRSDIPFEQQVKLDVQYIERQSMWFDLWILLKTIPAVLKARGAY